MNNKLIIVAMFMMFLLIIFNEYRVNNKHETFFMDVREFMSEGGRNTAQNGYDLCKKINILERVHKVKQTDCDAIYEVSE